MRLFDGDVAVERRADSSAVRIIFTAKTGEQVASDVSPERLRELAGLKEGAEIAMAEEKTNQAAAAEAQLDSVLETFEQQLDALGKRVQRTCEDTKGAFLDANNLLDHADHVNVSIMQKVSKLRSFFGPPPNSLGVEDAKLIEHDPLPKEPVP